MNTDVQSEIRFKLYEVATSISNLEVERNEAIDLLRSCLVTKSFPTIRDDIREHLAKYDVPF